MKPTGTTHIDQKKTSYNWGYDYNPSAFILADSRVSGGTEALLSFWGEPFMAQSTERNVPRFIFHVQRDSELLPHLVELERNCTRT